MNNNIKFSIILPVYNVADCLESCLNSLLNQTFKDYELICINDGSTDNSLEILEKFQDKFNNCKIISKENEGLSEARNMGFTYTKGEYICYIYSDDLIVPNFFEEISKKTETSPDVIIFGSKTYYTKSKRLKTGQYTSKNFPTPFNLNKIYSYHPVCWNKVYKRSFLADNKITFKNMQISEDQLFFIQIALLAKNVEVLKKDLYIYRKQRGSSLTGKKKKTDFASFESFEYIEEFANQHCKSEPVKLTILSRNLLKTFSRYPKCDKKIKAEYFRRLTILLNQIKEKPERFWWNYFKLKENYSYIRIKLEYIKSLLLYKIYG